MRMATHPVACGSMLRFLIPFLNLFCYSRIKVERSPSFILGQGNLQFVIRVASIPFYEDIILEGG